MKGIEINKKFFSDCAKNLLEEQFNSYIDKLAIGLVGNGSEFYGYDDFVSTDHDFEPGFCIFIDKETDEEIGYDLIRFYEKLPKEYLGVKLQQKNTYASQKYGVFVIEDFYRRLTGLESSPKNEKEWFFTPEFAFANATNGAIIFDNLGKFSAIRNEILNGIPEDVKLKKISARLALMAQSGQYNYERALKRKDFGSAQLSLNEYVNHAFYLFFVLNNTFTPYYKWRFRKLEEQKMFSNKCSELLYLITNPNFNEYANKKLEIVSNITKEIIMYLKSKELTDSNDDYLEAHAFSVQSRIKSRFLKSLHIMETGE